MKPTPQKISSIKKNIFYRSQNAISNYNLFDWHNYADLFNSSQVLAIDFWGCLKLSPCKNQIINTLFNKNCNNWEIDFEYQESDLLSEKRPTQIDVKIESESHAIIIESKFTETDGGKCSQLKLTEKKLFQCNGRYEDQVNPVNKIRSKCALSGKGIKYWDYIDYLTTYNKNISHNPCPIKDGEFQWIRNICFAEAYAKKNNKTSECYLVYYDSFKCPISIKVNNNTYLGNLKGNLLNSKTFMALSYNDLLTKTIIFLDTIDLSEKKIWIELHKWMSNKENQI